MGPVILAIGRRDNHAVVRSEAEKIGVTYLAIESHLASEYIQNPELIARLLDGVDKRRSFTKIQPTILTAIDSSVGAATLRSFAAASNKTFQLPISLRSDPRILDALGNNNISKIITQKESNQLFLISVARSAHGQVSLWPTIKLNSDGTSHPFMGSNQIDSLDYEEVNKMISLINIEIAELNLIGVLTYVFESAENVVLREWGVAPLNFWSENSCYTGVSEQLMRAIIDLPLGDISLIDLDSYYLEEELDLRQGKIAISSNNFQDYDPVRPLLHLYARNPKLKVSYIDNEKTQVKLSLFNEDEISALEEMAHAREFLLGD